MTDLKRSVRSRLKISMTSSRISISSRRRRFSFYNLSAPICMYHNALSLRPLIFRQVTHASRFTPFNPNTSTFRPLSFRLVARPLPSALAMAKRKRLSTATESPAVTTVPIPPPPPDLIETARPPLKRRASSRRSSQPATGSTNPDQNANVLDAPSALRASPDADEKDERMDLEQAGMDTEEQLKQGEEPPAQTPVANGKAASKKGAAKGKGAKAAKTEVNGGEAEVAASGSKSKKQGANSKAEPAVKTEVNGGDETAGAPGTKSKRKIAKVKAEPESPDATPKKEAANVKKDPQFLDPEAEGDEEADEEEIQAALSRPPPVNSDYLPLPWKGRLGYACLCTYLRFSNPPVFSSRTCRIASILENRHPLTDPNAPPHATKNRPDREKPADVARGQAFVESLGKANAKDIVKMLRWNDRYGIKFLRLSSEMFPFASHPEYGYKLAPFVSEELAEAGRVAAELGHRLTTHPGQVGIYMFNLIKSRLTFHPVHPTRLSQETSHRQRHPRPRLPRRTPRPPQAPPATRPRRSHDPPPGRRLRRQRSDPKPLPRELRPAPRQREETPRARKRRRQLVRPRTPPLMRGTQHPHGPRLPPPQHHLRCGADPRGHQRHRRPLPPHLGHLDPQGHHPENALQRAHPRRHHGPPAPQAQPPRRHFTPLPTGHGPHDRSQG